MKWYLIQVGNITHNIPTEDILEHTTTTPCWCQAKYSTEFDDYVEHNNFMPDADGNGEDPEDGKYH